MKKVFYLYVHEIALFVSDIAQALNWHWLWEQGGGLECWADEQLWKLEGADA